MMEISQESGRQPVNGGTAINPGPSAGGSVIGDFTGICPAERHPFGAHPADTAQSNSTVNESNSNSSGIRAAFFDIDGTLTSPRLHRVPSSTVRALKLLQRSGVDIFICTGRSPTQVSPVLDTMAVRFDGLVTLNGQMCRDTHGFEASQALDPADVLAVTAWLDTHAVVANFCELDYIYCNRVDELLKATWKTLSNNIPDLPIDDPHNRIVKRETFQISPFMDAREERELLDICHQTKAVRWSPNFCDLIPIDGGKDQGMKRLLKHYGMSPKQTIAFGDGGNDIAMLDYAGIGVAMGNAQPEVKDAADYVTRDVDDDGIMYALTSLGLL